MAGHDEQRNRVASKSRMVSWVRELLRERDEAQARNDEGGHGGRTAAAPFDVVSRIREHRLESEAVRPYVSARVVVGEDGRPALHAHDAAALGPAVTALDAALREEVDAVLVGVGALRSGRFRHPLADPGAREARRSHGLTLDPIGIVVSRGGQDVPAGSLGADEDGVVLLYTAAPDPVTAPRGVEVTRMARGELSATAALAHARRQHGVRTVLYEGGTRMLDALLAAGAIDELVLMIAPGVESDPEQPPITELLGFAGLAADRMWDPVDGITVLRLHPEPPRRQSEEAARARRSDASPGRSAGRP
jgi:riboflavin biosynthesis pyrimidine reductase